MTVLIKYECILVWLCIFDLSNHVLSCDMICFEVVGHCSNVSLCSLLTCVSRAQPGATVRMKNASLNSVILTLDIRFVRRAWPCLGLSCSSTDGRCFCQPGIRSVDSHPLCLGYSVKRETLRENENFRRRYVFMCQQERWASVIGWTSTPARSWPPTVYVPIDLLFVCCMICVNKCSQQNPLCWADPVVHWCSCMCVTITAKRFQVVVETFFAHMAHCWNSKISNFHW